MNKNDPQSSELSGEQLLKLLDLELEMKRSKRSDPKPQRAVLILGLLIIFALLGLIISFGLNEARALKRRNAPQAPAEAIIRPAR